MKILNLVFLCLILVIGPARGEEYKTTEWYELIPEGWEPSMPKKNEFGAMVYEVAPVVPTLDQQKLRLPGYIVPVNYQGTMVTEFLLVPYIGACLHVPPPPENQIVYVSLKEPFEQQEMWVLVWVSGLMSTKMSDTYYATAGYYMSDAEAEIYERESN